MHDAEQLARRLDQVTEELQPGLAAVSRARGLGTATELIDSAQDTTTLRIVEHEGVLRLDDPRPRTAITPTPLGRAAPSPAPARVVWEKRLQQLDRSQVTQWLETVDRKLTPNQGLRLWRDGVLRPAPSAESDGRVLLFVHGTFSNTENLFADIGQNPRGLEFLRWVSQTYAQVLTFDHPTLAVSPMLNARSLALLLKTFGGQIDVVCHSRGGLVTRWWLEGFDHAPPDKRMAIFVGSPLAGTGLAAAPNLRQSLGLLSNIGNALSSATAAFPFLTVLTGVFRIVASVTTVFAKTPAVDAAVALVPGLAAQSRVGNNRELLSLRAEQVRGSRRYFAVRSNFESEQPGWRFWRYFRRAGGRVIDVAADVVFDGPNDLVVDTGSMTELSDEVSLKADQILDFGTTDRVYHTNYFEQPQTLEFIHSKLAEGRV